MYLGWIRSKNVINHREIKLLELVWRNIEGVEL